MFRRRCARCGNRIRVRSRSCRHCAWRSEEDSPAASRAVTARRRVIYGTATVIALAVLLFVGHRTVEPTAIADWYAEFAMQHLPRQFSSLAPAESLTGAFHFCARRVVKDELVPDAVATFPPPTPDNTMELGDGTYRVQSHVYVDGADGPRVKREFTCTTQYDRNRWVLQQLEMGRYAQAVE